MERRGRVRGGGGHDGGSAYDALIESLIGKLSDPSAIFEPLVIERNGPELDDVTAEDGVRLRPTPRGYYIKVRDRPIAAGLLQCARFFSTKAGSALNE